MLLVLSSPSGAGKTTLARRLLAADAGIRMSVSVTTRKPRRGEVEGADYFFVDHAQFDRLRRARKLLEWAEVFGESYGTPKARVLEMVEAGTDVLFDIDWQGARQLKRRLPRDVVRVFILPPGRHHAGAAPRGTRPGFRGSGEAAPEGGGERDRPLARV